MKNKTRFFLVGIVLLGIVLFFVYFFSSSRKTKDSFSDEMEKINSKDWEQTGEFSELEDEGISFELSLIDRCDGGEWIDVKVVSSGVEVKEISGIVSSVEDGGIFYELKNAKGKLIFTRPEYGEFLEGRNVLLEVSESGEDFVVHKVRCVDGDGDEKNIKDESSLSNESQFEQEVMSQIEEGIDALTKKAGDWEVISFLWPNKEYVYVEFSAVENDSAFIINEPLSDDEVDSFLLLMKVNEKNQKIITEEIGLLKMDKEDKWVAERGKDFFDDVEDGKLFNFDADLGEWIVAN